MPFKSSARGAYGPQGQKVIKGPLAPVWVTSGTLTGATTAPYSFQLSATDDSGDAPTYSLASGSLNPGLTLSSTGLISGTATGTTNTATFTVRATDVNGRFTDSGTLTLVASLRAAATYTLAAVTALGSYVVGDVVNVSYTGSQQTIPKFNATSMRLICRGAAGGGYNYRAGGSGGYSEGVYAISGNIFCHVGGGGGSSTANNDAAGGYNGGGLGPGSDSNGANKNGSGGGATDFRTGSGTWDQNLNTRIIVAGGGGGTNAWNQGGDSQGAGPGGSGGGTNGGNGSGSGQNSNVGGGGTQTSGGNASAGGTGTGQSGGFGFGGAGFRISTSDPSVPGGGGGWYGGGAGAAQNESSAGGGSGYIGGVTSGVTTNGAGTAGAVTDSWTTNNQGNGSAQYVILATS